MMPPLRLKRANMDLLLAQLDTIAIFVYKIP